MSELIAPTDIRRFAFWSAYVLGSLTLALTWLLAHVPSQRHGADMRLDFALRACTVAFMLASILMARRIWKTNKSVTDDRGQGQIAVMQIVLAIAWIELAVALCGIVGIAIFRH